MIFRVIYPGALEPLLTERAGRGLFRVCVPCVFAIGDRHIVVPRGFITDGASIPRWARWAIESWGRVAFASILHDYMLEHTNEEKWLIDWCFYGMLRACGVGGLTAAAMYLAVRTRSAAARKSQVDGLGANCFA
jgi:hypothetical protein